MTWSLEKLFDRRNKVMHAKFATQVGPTCVCCERPALYRIGTKGYCKEHRRKPKHDSRHDLLSGEPR